MQEVLQVIGKQDINQMPIVEEGWLVGLLSWDSIMRYLQVLQSLADDTGVLLFEDIANAANGMDEPWFALRLELVAQVANVDFQDIR